MDIGQAAVDSIVPEGELGVIDAELVKERGVDVVHLGGVGAVERFVAPLIAFTVGDARLDSAPAKPVGEHIRIVIAAFSALG